jgi:endonuclease III
MTKSKIRPRSAGKTALKAAARSKKSGSARPVAERPTVAKPTKAAPLRPLGSAGLRSQVQAIIRGLNKTYPNATCALRHESAYQLIVATILSAQCTDERVNLVTPTLFAKYPDVQALARAEQAELEEIIRSTGFFRAKSTSLRGMAKAVVERFGGEIPNSLDDLVTLPGVGRKTANVVLGTVWGIATGVVVDTHVKRITQLLGITRSTTPEQIEQDLMAIVPQNEWVDFSHRLIHHGRQICIARRPKCRVCTLLACCKRVGLPPLEKMPVAK